MARFKAGQWISPSASVEMVWYFYHLLSHIAGRATNSWIALGSTEDCLAPSIKSAAGSKKKLGLDGGSRPSLAIQRQYSTPHLSTSTLGTTLFFNPEQNPPNPGAQECVGTTI